MKVPAKSKFQHRRAFASSSSTANKKVIENPFDKFANSRKKHEVINRKVKGEDRNVGRAREKSIDERKTKLLKEYHSNKKSNITVDKRFGESDPTLSLEEKMFMRFQKEKVKHVKNSSIYNLDSNDNEFLTHKGQVLGKSNLADADWVSDDDDDHDNDRSNSGNLNKDLVNQLHFGGGLQPTKHQNDYMSLLDNSNNNSNYSNVQYKQGKLDALQEIVMKSKLFKMQKKEAKEEQEEERSKLDRDYEDLFKTSMLDFNNYRNSNSNKSDGISTSNISNTNSKELDEYDQSLKEMTYEAKLPASERTKSPEEIALAEQTRIEELETKRLLRMKQLLTNSNNSNNNDDSMGVNSSKSDRKPYKHISDDAIEDENFEKIIKNKNKKDRERDMTNNNAYNDYIGVPNNNNNNNNNNNSNISAMDEEYEDSSEEEADDNEEDDDDEEEDDNEEDDNEEDDNEADGEEEDEEDEEDDNDTDGDNNSENDEDNDNEEEDSYKPTTIIVKKKSKEGLNDSSFDEKVNIEMPHKIDCPPDLEAFDELVEQYVKDELVDICALIDRILAWNNVNLPGSTGAENRNLMHNFLNVLLKHFIRVGDSLAMGDMEQQKNTLSQLNYLSGAIFKLSEDVGEACSSLWIRTLKIFHSQLQKRLRDYSLGQRDSTCWPSLGRILLLQLLGKVFSITDLKNDISGPATILLCQYLTQCPVSSISDISSGLLISSILLNYHKETKRYVPEVIAFIHTVLSLYLPSIDNPIIRKPQYFQNTFNLMKFNNLRNHVSTYQDIETLSISNILHWSYFNNKTSKVVNINNNEVASSVSILLVTYELLEIIINLYIDYNALPEILEPIIQTLCLIRPQDQPIFPKLIQEKHIIILEYSIKQINHIKQKRKPLQWRKSSIVSIEMKNPRFQLDYTFKKDKDPDQDRTKMKQLTRQLKREQKAAMRELRRDSDFIDQERYKETIKANEIRKLERNKNYSWLEDEQATINQQVRKGNSLMKGGGSGIAKKARVKRL